MREQGLFHNFFRDKKIRVGALIVLLKDNVSTKYVADCSYAG